MVVHVSNPSTWEVEQMFKVMLGFIVSLKPACDIQDFISKKKSLILYGGCETISGVGVCPAVHHVGSKTMQQDQQQASLPGQPSYLPFIMLFLI